MPVDFSVSKRKTRLERELKNIVRQLKQFKPKKIIQFGSLSRGEVGLTSDIDLIVIMDSQKPFHKRLKELYQKIDYREPLDLLAYTPEEFERTLRVSSFLRHAVKEGRVIYETK